MLRMFQINILFINILDTTVRRSKIIEDIINGAQGTQIGWITAFVVPWMTANIAFGKMMN